MSIEKDETWSAVTRVVEELDPVPAGLVARIQCAVRTELARPRRRAA